MERTVCIIPARYDSTRFPGKPLAPIRGASGVVKPLIQRTWEIAYRAGFETYVATDDERIGEVAQDFGANVLITSDELHNGTERCAAAAVLLDLHPSDVVINLQGDSCLTPARYLDTLDTHIKTSPRQVATIVVPRGPQYPAAPGEVQAVLDCHYGALYFTRGAIPMSQFGRYQHFGIYVYHVNALKAYARWKPSTREEAEQLEQLRFLENGWGIQCVRPSDVDVAPVREVNYPNDIAAVEEELKKWNIV